MKKKTEPKIGDKIYVPSSLYVYRGCDDFHGGKATINKIERSPYLSKDHPNYIFIGIKERPGHMYNYKVLAEDQKELSKQYKGYKAHPDPDYSPESNDSNADWWG